MIVVAYLSVSLRAPGHPDRALWTTKVCRFGAVRYIAFPMAVAAYRHRSKFPHYCAVAGAHGEGPRVCCLAKQLRKWANLQATRRQKQDCAAGRVSGWPQLPLLVGRQRRY